MRSVLDAAAAFGAAPFVDLDHMPRALSVNRSFARVASLAGVRGCLATWSNRVSNAAPASAEVFAAAATGLVRRIAEGSGGEAGRTLRHIELWNEPELAYAWDPSFEPRPGLDLFFATALTTLVRLDAYRRESANPVVKQLRFGLASFARADTAVVALDSLDANALPGGAHAPFDFVSFHSYDNDPLRIVADIERVVAARARSTHDRNIALVLSEGGVHLEAPSSPSTLEHALLVSTVLALGATLGLDRAHHSLFYDFYEGLPFGLINHSGRPTPLFHAYTLLARAMGGGAARVPLGAPSDGRLGGGEGAILAARDVAGKLRVLVVNRGVVARTLRIDLGSAGANATGLLVLDDPAAEPRAVRVSGPLLDVPARAVMVVELDG